MGRDFQIWRLLQQGYSQEEVGELFGLTHQGISKIATDVKNHISGIQTQYSKGKDIAEIAQFEGIDEVTAWTMALNLAPLFFCIHFS